MFFATYKATIKNLIRAALLWILLLLVLAVVVSRVSSVSYSHSIVEGDKIVNILYDTDPEFQFDYHGYVQALRNNFSTISIYAIPLFAVITVLLVLSRDYKDSFFEIEKAGGVSAGTYFLGRLAAILTVNIAAGLFVTLFHSHLYCYTRHIASDLAMPMGNFLLETTVRVIRLYFLGMLPGILFYLGITYMAGSLLKSGFFGTLVSSSWILFIYTASRNVKLRLSPAYEFLDPHTYGFYGYWGYYDTEWFTDKALRNPWSAGELIMHTALIAGVGIIGFTVAYFSTKKRTI